MKKVRAGKSATEDDLRPEYDFDYSQAKPNRFAARFSADTIAVVLDPDVAEVFRDSEAVNALLRSVIAVLPKPAKAPKARSRPKEANTALSPPGSARR